jgi:acyl-CoA reductase-like NAD-dependent aldehyde dehydrogenase
MNFSWQGQSCGSTSRLLLHEDIHDAVLERRREDCFVHARRRSDG